MTQLTPAKEQELKERQRAPLSTPTDLSAEATRDITGALNAILADVFALYLKSKNFHWHLSGPHFRDYHLMFDEQADQIFAMTDPVAERVRKLGGSTLKSIGHIKRLQRACGRPTTSAKSSATSPLPALSKSGSMKPSGGPGSCSSRVSGG